MNCRISPRVSDLTGQRFGKLIVVCLSGYNKWNQTVWLCRCDCGETHEAAGRHLKTGNIQSCGCHRNKRHGHSSRILRSSTYISWQAMKNRCTNQSHQQYKDYGARGITVCERWEDFAKFLADMGERPKGKTLDRIENDKGYEPGNCCWSTRKEQIQNRRPLKLTKEQIIAIRSDPRPSSQIAADYPVNRRHVSSIKKGERCSHTK